MLLIVIIRIPHFSVGEQVAIIFEINCCISLSNYIFLIFFFASFVRLFFIIH